MSLLMQALKKAEHAKQQQTEPQESATVEEQISPAEPPASNFSLAPLEEAAAAPSALKPATYPVLSAEEEIAVPQERPSKIEPALEIESVAPPQAIALEMAETQVIKPRPQVETVAAPPPAPEPAKPPIMAPAPERAMPPPQPSKAAERSVPGARQTAQAVFASKQPVRSKRVWRIAGISIIVLLCAGFGFGYFYLQNFGNRSNVLAPASPPAATTVATPSPPDPATAGDPKPEPAAAAIQVSIPVPATAAASPASASAAAVSEPRPTVTAAAREPEAKPAAAKPTAKSIEHSGIQIRQTNQSNQVNPVLSSAYQAFIAGDLNTAQQQYQQVLQFDSTNRDALLGLAAIAVTRKQPAQAGALYVKLLELDPNDTDAIAGMTSLQSGNVEQNESRLKKLLAQNPQAGAIHFVLGNLYAQQTRWAEAQQAYFNAYGATPSNADYAFNLAVSLDRLGQSKLAFEYYQRAASVAQSGPVNFSKSAVQTRIKELQGLIEN